MNTLDVLVGFAIAFGIFRMLPLLLKIYKTGNVSSFSTTYIILGIVSSSIWFCYGVVHKSPLIMSQCTAALLAEIYILYKIYVYAYSYERERGLKKSSIE
jgi:uncharacterized protein with PQ loop repeat